MKDELRNNMTINTFVEVLYSQIKSTGFTAIPEIQ